MCKPRIYHLQANVLMRRKNITLQLNTRYDITVVYYTLKRLCYTPSSYVSSIFKVLRCTSRFTHEWLKISRNIGYSQSASNLLLILSTLVLPGSAEIQKRAPHRLSRRHLMWDRIWAIKESSLYCPMMSGRAKWMILLAVRGGVWTVKVPSRHHASSLTCLVLFLEDDCVFRGCGSGYNVVKFILWESRSELHCTIECITCGYPLPRAGIEYKITRTEAPVKSKSVRDIINHPFISLSSIREVTYISDEYTHHILEHCPVHFNMELMASGCSALLSSVHASETQ